MTATKPAIGRDFAPRPGFASRTVAAARRGMRALATPDRITVVAIVAGALALSTWNILGGPDFQDDEGTYAAQAIAIREGQLAPYTYWYDHPPLGWIQLAVFAWIPEVLGLGEGLDIGTMRYVVAFYFAANCALVYLLARRVGTRMLFALVASAIYAFSPLSLLLGRQVYLDTVALPWLLLAFYFALSPRRALWHHVAAGAFFATALLTKLTYAVFGPVLLLAMLDRHGWRGRTFSIVGFLSVGGLVLALFPLMALLRGELLSGPGHVSLQDGLAYQFFSRSGSGWIWEPGSSRSELFGSWLSIDRLLIISGLAAAVICLFTRRTRWISLALIFFAGPIVLSTGYMPAMYVIGAIPFLALAVGCSAELLWRSLTAILRSYLPGARLAGPVLVTSVFVVALVLIPITEWVKRDAQLLAADENSDWRQTLEWSSQNIPKDEVVLVPYSMWQDLNRQGWNDPWRAIVLEKADLDTRFALEHPGGWPDIQWIVEGPTVAANIDYLSLNVAGTALEHSRIVASFGAWNIREVLTSAK